MPDSIALLAQADAQFDLHRARDFKGRGVVEIGQRSHQAQPSELHKEIGLNAKLVAVKVQVGVESAHVHVDQRLAPLVVRSANEVTDEIDAFVRQARRKPQP